MLKYIIRLDDACPTMNKEKWDRIEILLEKYNIKPIVGVIPDNKDPEFNNKEIKDFWEKYVLNWQNKNWIIAQHGLYHNLNKQIRTEFKNKKYEEQLEILKKGQEILANKKIKTDCFFAPAHTFDKNTVLACNNLNYFKFISDGYAFYPYKSKGMIFLPSVFDTPHVISKFGVFTFVYHPNKMDDKDFEYLESFIKQNIEKFDVDILDIIDKYKNRRRNVFDFFLYVSISFFRFIRKVIKGED